MATAHCCKDLLRPDRRVIGAHMSFLMGGVLRPGLFRYLNLLQSPDVEAKIL